MKKILSIFFILTLLALMSAPGHAVAQNELSTKIRELADKLTSSTSGQVIGVDGNLIYINLGTKDAIYVGAQFEVVRLGDVMMLNGKHYYKERPAGVIRITRVREALSIAKATTIFEPIQKGDKVYQSEDISLQPPATPGRTIHNSIVKVSGVDLPSVFRRLEAGGFNPGPYSENDLNRLSESLKKFQQFSKINSTGVLDAATWTKLKILYDPKGGSSETVQTPVSPHPSYQPPPARKTKRIAVMEFAHGDCTNDLTKNIYESLSIYFPQKGFQVVERSQLNRILEEQKVAYSGLVDVSTAQKLGEMLGSDMVLLGTLSDMGNSIAIRARMVDVGKGVVLTAAEVSIKETSDITQMVENKHCSDAVASPRKKDEKKKGPAPAPISKLFYENDVVRIDVLSFTREAEGLVLKLKFVNRAGSDSCQMGLMRPKERTYLVDSDGNRYGFKNSALGDRRKIFPTGVPNAYTIVFRDIKNGSNKFILSAYINGTNTHGCPDFFLKIEDLTL
jgi:TolB-like protein